MRDRIHIAPAVLTLETLRAHTALLPDCGASLWFGGVVRNDNVGKAVRAITYECHEPMARKELQAIVTEARAQWDIAHVVILHRTGDVAAGEMSLFIWIAAAHRQPAFAAMPWIIDQLKARVPIWKQEHYVDDTAAWLAG